MKSDLLPKLCYFSNLLDERKLSVDSFFTTLDIKMFFIANRLITKRI